MYWQDARELHGSGRKSFPDNDHLRNGLGCLAGDPGEDVGGGRMYIGATDHLSGGASPRKEDDSKPDHDKRGVADDPRREHGHAKYAPGLGRGRIHNIGPGENLIQGGTLSGPYADSPGHGHSRGDDFEGGIQRGIGHGRHKGIEVPLDFPGAHGHSRDDDFEADQGLQRGIGFGKHKVKQGEVERNRPDGGRPVPPVHVRRPEEGGDPLWEPATYDVYEASAAAHGWRREDQIDAGLQRFVGRGKHHVQATHDGFTDGRTRGPGEDLQQQTPGLHGHSKDDDFEGAFPRFVGHGHRQAEAAVYHDHFDGIHGGHEAEGDAPDEGPHGRHYIGCEDHMADFTGGDMVYEQQCPDHVRGGHGRKHFDVEDHIAPRAHIPTSSMPIQQPQGRKHANVPDHLLTEVFMPPDPVGSAGVPREKDMKDAIREWAVQHFNLVVSNENRWKDVHMTPKGNHWTLEALTEQRKSISREAASAQLLSEKLSLMTVTELRHFGLRFRGPNEPMPEKSDVKHPGACRKKRVQEVNPTLTSSGMLGVLGQEPDRGHNMSFARRVPEEQQRRFIASGTSHFEEGHKCTHGDKPGAHGHARNDDFEEGIERGIGHGKRNIRPADHIFGGTGHHTPPGSHGQQRAHGLDEGIARDIGHGRRFIGGRDHMVEIGCAREGVPGSHGHSRADDYQDGIHRDIGQGRRHCGF